MTDWPVKTLGEVAAVNPSEPSLSEDAPFVPMDAVAAGERDIQYTQPRGQRSGARARAGDILFARITPCLQNGKVALVQDEIARCGGSTEFIVVRAGPEVLNGYLYQWITSERIRDEVTALMKGATGRQRLNAEDLALTELPVPPLGEQKRIIALLDAATARVTELTACYEQARTHANNLFSSALRDALESNPDWPVKTLGEICELQRGHDLPTPERREGEVPILGSTGVTGFHSVARYEGPGVAIGRSGFIGGAQYCDVSYWPLNTCLFVKNFFGNEPRWVYYILKNIDFSQYNSGTTQPSLNRNNLSHIPVSTPSLGAQQEIVAQLELMVAKTSEMVAAYDAKLQAAKDLRQSILEAAFAGDL